MVKGSTQSGIDIIKGFKTHRNARKAGAAI